MHFATTDLRGSVPLKYDWYYALRFTVYYGCGGQRPGGAHACQLLDRRSKGQRCPVRLDICIFPVRQPQAGSLRACLIYSHPKHAGGCIWSLDDGLHADRCLLSCLGSTGYAQRPETDIDSFKRPFTALLRHVRIHPQNLNISFPL